MMVVSFYLNDSLNTWMRTKKKTFIFSILEHKVKYVSKKMDEDKAIGLDIIIAEALKSQR